MRTEEQIKFEIVTELPIDEVIELYQAGGWWTESQKAREIIPAMIKGSFCFMIATFDHKIVGMGRVISDGVSDGYIQDVVVKEEFRNLHIGTELVTRLAAFCSEKGLEWIGLIAEPKTTPFYERIGFEVIRGAKPMVFNQFSPKKMEENG